MISGFCEEDQQFFCLICFGQLQGFPRLSMGNVVEEGPFYWSEDIFKVAFALSA